FMSVSFIGASAGSALGLWLWDAGGWAMFCYGCVALVALNIGVFLFYKKRSALTSTN
ncbi:MAG: MFS transporter, partial [Chitinophagaceae bacterium]